MATQLAYINGETLKTIRDKMRVSETHLEHKAKLAAGRISLWESSPADDFPTMKQAVRISTALKIPLAGLYMDPSNLPDLGIPKGVRMRRFQITEVSDDSALNIAISTLCGLRRQLIELFEELGEPIVSTLLPALDSNPAIAAAQLRKAFGLSVEEQKRLRSSRKLYKRIRSSLEMRGVVLAEFTDVDLNECRGLALYFDEFSIAGVNKEDRWPAKCFSAIHEIGHLANRLSATCYPMDYRVSNPEEVYCNALAGCFLVPESSLRKDVEVIHDFTSIELLKALADNYCVSREVIARRLYDLGYLSSDDYDNVIDVLQRQFEEDKRKLKLEKEEGKQTTSFWQKPERVAVDVHGALFVDAVRRSVDAGLMGEFDASGLLGVSPSKLVATFREALS